MREFTFFVKCGTTFLSGWLSRESLVRIVVESPKNPAGIPMELAVTAETFDDAGQLIFDSLNACWEQDCPEAAKMAGHPYELRLPPEDRLAALDAAIADTR